MRFARSIAMPPSIFACGRRLLVLLDSQHPPLILLEWNLLVIQLPVELGVLGRKLGRTGVSGQSGG